MPLPTQPSDLLSESDYSALANLAEAADTDPNWPAAAWDVARRAGVLEWAIPTQFGGRELEPTALLLGYERLAGACLTTAFILSQRDAAVRRIRDNGRDDLCRDLLRPLACGGRFATVGLSQLTTSRQHGSPALRAEESAAAFILDGVMPWVTGADLGDGRQVMVVLPADTPGVSVKPPMDLAALAGWRTAEVVCDRVTVE